MYYTGHKYNSGDPRFPTTDKDSRVKDYTRGGAKFRQASQTTIVRPPMGCPDFVIGLIILIIIKLQSNGN
jgi:hypothetical protein